MDRVSTEKKTPTIPSSDAKTLIDRRRALLGPSYLRYLFYTDPVHFVRGDGAWLYDQDGKAYLDAYNNVPAVGHCHPRIVSAIADQAGILNVHTRYLDERLLDYAERLTQTFPSELSQVMFTCTGTEANELAYMIARAATGGTGFIVTENAYHGNSVAISELSPAYGDTVTLPLTTRTVSAPNAYRGSGADVAAAFAEEVRAAVADLESHGIRPAALLVDLAFSSDGILFDPPGFLKPAAAAIRDAGGLYIADEVQAGFARTGEGMWGFSHHGVTPDLVTLGKPMGNGYPIGGVVARPEILDDFGKRRRYFNTFAGAQVGCAAGLAVLDVIESEGLIESTQRVGDHLISGLRTLMQRHRLIGDVRGLGLFVGVELVRDRKTKEHASNETVRAVDALRDRRILVASTGPGGNVLKIRPPLVFSEENADRLIGELDAVLTDIESSLC